MAREFADAAGRKWSLSFTAADLTAIREGTGLTVGKMALDKLAEELSDPEQLVAVLWVLVEDQAAKVGLTPEQFARGLDGDAMEAATLGFWRAWADFCPPHPRRLILGMVDKMLEDQRAAVDKAMETLLTSNGSAGSSGAPPASTPGPTPSAP